MSEKIKSSLKTKRFTIEGYQLQYLNDIDTVQRSMNYYQDQLKTNYLQQIAVRLGYKADDQLEFTIDLKSDSRELKIKKIN